MMVQGGLLLHTGAQVGMLFMPSKTYHCVLAPFRRLSRIHRWGCVSVARLDGHSSYRRHPAGWPGGILPPIVRATRPWCHAHRGHASPVEAAPRLFYKGPHVLSPARRGGEAVRQRTATESQPHRVWLYFGGVILLKRRRGRHEKPR